MLPNLAGWDRVVRILVGTLLLTWAVAGGPFWAYLGIPLIITGAWGFCIFYRILGIQTKRR